jgi:hypothetical protein
MRTTVIPAQVTTVEDTIAGSLNFTQILLLVTSLFANTFVYALMPERMKFSLLKLGLMAIIFAVFILLSLKIKGRIVLSWLTILATYVLRPHTFIFSKNTLFARDIQMPIAAVSKIAVKTRKTKKIDEAVTVPDFDYESIVRNTNLNLRFGRKGILIVKNYD